MNVLGVTLEKASRRGLSDQCHPKKIIVTNVFFLSLLMAYNQMNVVDHTDSRAGPPIFATPSGPQFVSSSNQIDSESSRIPE